jgi:hypothetical protein
MDYLIAMAFSSIDATNFFHNLALKHKLLTDWGGGVIRPSMNKIE